MKMKARLTTTVVRLLLAVVMIGGAMTTAIPAMATPAPHGAMAATPIVGTGKATAHSATVNAAMASSQMQSRTAATTTGALGIDGKPTGSALPAATATTTRPTPNDPADRPGGPNVGQSSAAAIRSARVTPGTAAAAAAGTQGISQATSGCTNCATPDVTGAVSATQIAETANLRLQVFNKSGTSLCNVSLTSLLGATTALRGPRIQYDTTNKRFSMVIDSVPATSGDVPIQYLATSQADDACGAWWIYSTIFSGSGFPLGTLLDFPYLGQDSTSILSSTNNFNFSNSYIGSTAFAMPKSVAYTGGAFSFNTYSVAFSTAPVTVAGTPIPSTTNTYWLAAVPGTGYDLYAMPTSPAGAISLQATISASFSAPSRRIRQPGTSTTLDPLDGRIGSAAVQTGSVVWFAHDIDDQGFPTVRYGAVSVTSNQAFTAVAFHTSGSDDFNPSVGVSPASGNTDNIWVNWAYTDSANGVATSDTVAGVPAGAGVPDLAGQDLTLVNGSATTSQSSFGRYSSVEVDPSASSSSCPAGLTALSAQEYFGTNGQWNTELARTTFC